MYKVAIIGAGFSGLSIGKMLLNKGIRTDDIILLESSPRIGGLIQTSHQNGYHLDWGPQGLQTKSKVVQNYMQSINLVNNTIRANKNVNKRYIVHKGQIRALPNSLLSFLTNRTISIRSKFRLLREPFISPESEEESISKFFDRRIGSGFDHILDAFISGVYGGSHKRISIDHAFPMLKLLELEYGSLIKGMWNQRKKKNQMLKNTPKSKEKPATLSTLSGGMEDVITHLSKNLTILTNTTVSNISTSNNHYIIRTEDNSIEASSVVLAISPNHIQRINLEGLTQDENQPSISPIPEAKVSVISLGFDKSAFSSELKGYGYLSPSTENRFCLGILFVSSFFPSFAPPNKILLRCFVGGMRNPGHNSFDETLLVDHIMKDVNKLLHCQKNPEMIHIARNRGIPQLELGHKNIIEFKNRLEASNPGLFISGIGWTGISIEHLMKEVQKLIPKAMNFC